MADARATSEQTSPDTSENNGFRYGVITGIILIVYTLAAAFLGFFSDISGAAIDLLIMTAGVVVAIRQIKERKGMKLAYLQGFGTGIITAMVSSVLLAFFVLVFSTIKPELMGLERIRDLFGFDLSLIMAFLAIILAGSMWGMIVSLIAMQYYKSDSHQPVEGIE